MKKYKIDLTDDQPVEIQFIGADFVEISMVFHALKRFKDHLIIVNFDSDNVENIENIDKHALARYHQLLQEVVS